MYLLIALCTSQGQDLWERCLPGRRAAPGKVVGGWGQLGSVQNTKHNINLQNTKHNIKIQNTKHNIEIQNTKPNIEIQNTKCDMEIQNITSSWPPPHPRTLFKENNDKLGNTHLYPGNSWYRNIIFRAILKKEKEIFIPYSVLTNTNKERRLRGCQACITWLLAIRLTCLPPRFSILQLLLNSKWST